MKTNIYISIILLFLASSTMFSQTSIESASEAYRNEEFDKSIQLYEQVIAQGLHENMESAELYYNLANAYFRVGENAKSILNYERALILNPGDSDIKHNLRFARTRLEDKIDVTETFFLSSWIRNIQNKFNSNTWANIGIVMFIFFLVSIAAYLFIKKIIIRKISFYTAIVLLVFVFISNSFAFKQKNKSINRNTGIIMTASASIMTSPDANSQELFRLHEGTKVKLRKTDKNWTEIEIANGSVGWISKENVEAI